MSGIREVVLVQPPFVQLNSPYPAPYYLKGFLEKRGFRVTVLDHSIGLFEKIFCRSGLEQIFHDASLPSSLSKNRQNKNIAPIIERFLSERNLWLASIDRLIAFLRGRDPEWGHLLALANGCLPGGPRTDTFIAERDGEVSADETKIFATMLFSDMADFITCTLDSGFSLIRYTPLMEGSLNTGCRDFAAVKKSLDGYIMNAFYRPMLNEEWDRLEKAKSHGGPFLLGLTIPFPGCLSGALVCAESAKKRFGSAVRTVAGGGYVNTELRFQKTPELSAYFDYVSLDRGYGSLLSILEHPDAGQDKAALEDEAARSTFPDYSAVDFSRYLYPADDANPMHRLWSDGHWLKAYLAHGCYWHSCAFCDVTLDYIKNFVPVDTAALFAHLKDQAEKTGVRGVHLVDEAAPVSSLLEFALLNREAELPLNFWGNIRFEKDFSPDAAAILAAGGLTGVSAGLEVATERGFKRLGKGITLESAVRACAAFKEAGILTHAYLIYGYWDEDEQEIIDSAEILRQLFALGLLDSAFWHKFVLTRHSRIYAEKQRGLHPCLAIKDDPGGESGGIFALNDLSFEGEEQFNKYSQSLEMLLGAWMSGETETPVTEAFPFKVKPPSVSPNLVEEHLNNYMSDRDSGREAMPGNDSNVLFLGSAPRRSGNVLRWRWRLQERELKAGNGEEAEKLAGLLETASRGNGLAAGELYAALKEIGGNELAKISWARLRENGLAVYR
ncbi:MAG: radical SAM protein [Treponema sp.]|nr:radical SAM protein [Treponema sp.]MCL2233349.1 radical SAM protein [Treponema sp.]